MVTAEAHASAVLFAAEESTGPDLSWRTNSRQISQSCAGRGISGLKLHFLNLLCRASLLEWTFDLPILEAYIAR